MAHLKAQELKRKNQERKIGSFCCYAVFTKEATIDVK
jgi:hypothetical protein